MSELLIEKIRAREAIVSVIGLGYVGLPLAVERGGPHPLDSSAAKLRWIPGSCF